MTLLNIARKLINLEQITFIEDATWQESQPNGKVAHFEGVKVHFVGGSVLRLIGAEATALRKQLQG